LEELAQSVCSGLLSYSMWYCSAKAEFIGMHFFCVVLQAKKKVTCETNGPKGLVFAKHS